MFLKHWKTRCNWRSAEFPQIDVRLFLRIAASKREVTGKFGLFARNEKECWENVKKDELNYLQNVPRNCAKRLQCSLSNIETFDLDWQNESEYPGCQATILTPKEWQRREKLNFKLPSSLKSRPLDFLWKVCFKQLDSTMRSWRTASEWEDQWWVWSCDANRVMPTSVRRWISQKIFISSLSERHHS